MQDRPIAVPMILGVKNRIYLFLFFFFFISYFCSKYCDLTKMARKSANSWLFVFDLLFWWGKPQTVPVLVKPY